MTTLQLYRRLGDLKHLGEIYVCPSTGEQHLEKIVSIDFVPEVNGVVIRTEDTE